jgi:hypothetical protein
MIRSYIRFAIGTLAIAFAMPASAAIVFSTNFDGALPAQITGAGGLTNAGTLPVGQFGTGTYRNATTGNPATSTILSLAGLAAHSTVSVSFDFIAWDSWDGRVLSFPQGDFFNMLLDGMNVFTISPSIQSGIAQIPNSAVLTFGAGGVNLGQNGFNDQVYRVTLSGLSHSASTLNLNMFADGVGWQGGDDESWGIDNLVVSTENVVIGAVPEAPMWMMMMTGFALVGGALRSCRSPRRRLQQA